MHEKERELRSLWTKVSYDYKEYTACGGTATQIFRLVTGGTFESVYLYNGTCYENPSSTGSTSSVDAAGLSFYNNCGACTPTPTPVPVAPVPTPSTGIEIFSTNTVGNGLASPNLVCPLATTNSMYTTRANVASILVNDIIYTM